MPERKAIVSAFEDFKETYMFLKFRSPVTRRGYRYDIQHWLNVSGIIYVDEIDIGQVLQYFTTASMKELKASSLSRKIAALRAFFVYLEVQELLPKDTAAKLITPKIGKAEPRPLNKSQYTAILREAANNPRDYAILELLLQTGIRLSELTGLKLEDIDLPTKPSPKGDNGYGVMRITRKRSKQQELIVNYKACKAVLAYLKARPESSDPHVFLNKYGEQLINRSVEKLFKKYATAAGMTWAHVHTFRTTNITEHLANGTDIKTVQTNAGHESLATTNVYAGYVKSAQVKAMQEHAL